MARSPRSQAQKEVTTLMQQTNVSERVMHSIQETAFLLNLSTRKVHYLIAEKKIKTLKCGKRRLIPRTEILRLSREAR
jgi:excisionase family DNA binding protein